MKIPLNEIVRRYAALDIDTNNLRSQPAVHELCQLVNALLELTNVDIVKEVLRFADGREFDTDDLIGCVSTVAKLVHVDLGGW